MTKYIDANVLKAEMIAMQSFGDLWYENPEGEPLKLVFYQFCENLSWNYLDTGLREDLRSEMFIQLVKKLGLYKPTGSAFGWCTMVAKRRASDFLKITRRARRKDATFDEHGFPLPKTDNQPEKQIE